MAEGAACFVMFSTIIVRRRLAPDSHTLWAKGKQGIGRYHSSKRSSCVGPKNHMNAELVNEALKRVENPYVLVNLISQRVRRLNAGSSGMSRPLIANAGNLGVADMALREIIEDKMGFEMPELVKPTRTAGQRRNRPQGWLRPNAAANKLAA
jgi:DNA-directed RNA polymerase subunit omega